jgi:Ran GTPase-activating protein 1
VPDLETIICGRNRLESGSMAAWARMLGLHNKIKTLRMVQNGIRPEGLAVFFRDGVSNTTDIQTLDLNDNTLTVVASRELARVLPLLTKLTELNIGDAVLSNKGGSAIFRALGKGGNVALEKLSVQYGEVNTNGLKKLVEAVESIPKLRKVELNGNKFSEDDDSVEVLRGILEKRKEALGDDGEGTDDDDDDAWGLDELDEMDYDSDESLESDEDLVEEAEEEEEKKDADEPVSKPEKDKDVLDITEALKKAEI